MKRRYLFPFAATAVLALSACSGGAPATPAPPAESSNETSEAPDPAPPSEGTESTPEAELPSGGEATVTIDGRVYEFTSDPVRLGVDLSTVGCKSTFDTALTVDLSLVAIDGEHNTDGSLFLIVGESDSEQYNTFDLRANTFGAPEEKVAYMAGDSLIRNTTDDPAFGDVEDQPITLTHNGMTVSGAQQVYNIAEGSANPGVSTVQVDARCMNF